MGVVPLPRCASGGGEAKGGRPVGIPLPPQFPMGLRPATNDENGLFSWEFPSCPCGAPPMMKMEAGHVFSYEWERLGKSTRPAAGTVFMKAASAAPVS